MKAISGMFIIFLIIGMLTACSTPEEKAHKAKAKNYNAQEKIHTERLNLVNEYKKCLEKAGEDKTKVEACDQYLRAAEALK